MVAITLIPRVPHYDEGLGLSFLRQIEDAARRFDAKCPEDLHVDPRLARKVVKRLVAQSYNCGIEDENGLLQGGAEHLEECIVGPVCVRQTASKESEGE